MQKFHFFHSARHHHALRRKLLQAKPLPLQPQNPCRRADAHRLLAVFQNPLIIFYRNLLLSDKGNQRQMQQYFLRQLQCLCYIPTKSHAITSFIHFMQAGDKLEFSTCFSACKKAEPLLRLFAVRIHFFQRNSHVRGTASFLIAAL